MRRLSSLSPNFLKDKVCLLRIDLNTEDSWRLEASLPTIKFLSRHCRAVVILSHKGRPNGYNQSLSLKKEAGRISRKTVFIPHFRFREIKNLIGASPRGSLYLLENLRFLKEEENNNPVLAEHLASLGDIYVNDAFAVSHRANASVVVITKLLPSYAGFGMESEIKNLSKAMKNPRKPLTVILGGLKIRNKLGVIKNLQKKASIFLIGGALDAKTLKSLRKIKKAVLPADFRYEKGAIRDIGPKTAKAFVQEIKKARTIVWNGPIGDIKQRKFESGTKAVARAVAGNKKAFKIVGGGETVMYLKKLKLDKKMNFVSTGGGAMLDFLAGKKLPGLEALKND